MGRLSVPLLALAVLVGAPGSDAAPPQKHYSRLYVQAHFHYDLDYGSHPDAVFNGKFGKDVSYSARAILVYDGRSASLLPGAGMAVQGYVGLKNEMTQGFTVIERGEARVVRRPYECKGPGAVPGDPGYYFSGTGSNSGTGPNSTERFVFTKGASVSISNAGLYVDPGHALTDVGCVATESLPAHGLRPGLTIAVSPPPRSRVTGTTAFSTHCADFYDHDFIRETGGNGHAFRGFVMASATLTPFPAADLAATKKRLRDSIEHEDPSHIDLARARNDCIR